MKKSLFILAIIAVITFFLLHSNEHWESITVPEGTASIKILAIDIYRPFDKHTLLDDPQSSYGDPEQCGHEGDRYDRVNWDEFVGSHGRIRIYHSHHLEEGLGIDYADWLEVYPGRLYLHDVIKKEYLEKLPRQMPKGRWKLYIAPPEHPWHLTLDLDGNAVIRITDFSK